MTGREREGSRAGIITEGMLQIELFAHPADERDRVLAGSESPLDRQLGDVVSVFGADMNTAAVFDEGKTEIRRAVERCSCGKPGNQRMLRHPAQCASVPTGGLPVELRGMARPARLRADKIFPLPFQWRSAR